MYVLEDLTLSFCCYIINNLIVFHLCSNFILVAHSYSRKNYMRFYMRRVQSKLMVFIQFCSSGTLSFFGLADNMKVHLYFFFSIFCSLVRAADCRWSVRKRKIIRENPLHILSIVHACVNVLCSVHTIRPCVPFYVHVLFLRPIGQATAMA